MNVFTSCPPHRQHGAASIAIAMLIMFILAAAVTAVLHMSGSSVIDAAKNEEQIAAFFLAESGLERGRSLLRSASDPTAKAACETTIPGSSSLGRGTVTLSAAASGCDAATPPVNCTSCTITSTGAVGSSSRTVVSVVSLAGPSGGATGCGGSGTTPVNCPVSNVPAANKLPDIDQTIEVTTPPVVLVSNMAFLRHPQSSSNNVDAAAACVTFPPSGPCLTKWNVESNHSSGISVVGSRGASVEIPAAGSYTLTQNLTADSLYAAVGARFGGNGATPTIVGAYWDDDSNGSGNSTVEQGNGVTGRVNNGTACAVPGTPDYTTCPAATTITPGMYDTKQASKSWCYGADTLVFGLSGSAGSSTGRLNSFQFGSAPASTEVPNGFAIFVNPNTGGSHKSPYSALRYIHNPNLSPNPTAANASSYKGNGTGAIGATFTGRVDSGTPDIAGTILTVTGAPAGYPNTIISPAFTGPPAYLGDTLASTGPAPNVSGNPYITTQLTSNETGGALGGRGTYQISGGNQNVTPRTMTASSKILHISNCTICFFAPADAIVGTTYSISSQPSGTTGGVGNYLLSGTPANGTTRISSPVLAGIVGTTIYLPAAESTPAVTSPNTRIAIQSGTGVFAANTTVTGVTSPAPNTATNSFTVSSSPTTALDGATLCGGICAYFNQGLAANTSFTIGITDTGDWAAGMLCLKGIDTSTIVGLTGTGAAVKATNWHELVR